MGILNFVKRTAAILGASLALGTVTVTAESFVYPQQQAEAQTVCNPNVYKHCLPSRRDDNPERLNQNLSCTYLQPNTSFGVWGCNPIFSPKEIAERSGTCQRITSNGYFKQSECKDSDGQISRKTWQPNGRVTTLPIAYSPHTQKRRVSRNNNVRKKFVTRGGKRIEYRRNSRGWYRYRSR